MKGCSVTEQASNVRKTWKGVVDQVKFILSLLFKV